MKNIQKTILLILIAFFFPSAVLAQCDTCLYEEELNRKPILLEDLPVITANDTFILFDTCSSTNNAKCISFIHGLGGDPSSWAKPKVWSQQNYQVATINPNYSGYETSFHDVAESLNTQIGSAKDAGINQVYPNRCDRDDYAIAHSQGGVAARYLDYQWDTDNTGNFGNRKFHGLVTFGTPNAGAYVATTQGEHADFIQKVVSTIILHEADEKVFDLTEDFGFFVGQSAIQLLDSLDDLVKQHLAPLMLSPLHTGTLNEMKPNAQVISDINNHQSRLHKIAFYGIEEAPECWRVMDDIVHTSSSSKPLWGSNRDQGLVDTMEDIRNHHTAEIANLDGLIKKRTKWYRVFKNSNKKTQNCIAERDRRNESVQFLNNANTIWRYLIGSFQPYVYNVDTKTRHTGRVVVKKGMFFNHVMQKQFETASDAQDWTDWQASLFGAGYTVIKTVTSKTIQVKTKKFFPSDGVVLAKSQIAFAGAPQGTEFRMPKSNHFQMRNDENTERCLKDLYLGKFDTYFKLEEK